MQLRLPTTDGIRNSRPPGVSCACAPSCSNALKNTPALLRLISAPSPSAAAAPGVRAAQQQQQRGTTDAAIAKLNATQIFTSLLSYHIVPGVAARSSDLADGQNLSTALRGVSLRVLKEPARAGGGGGGRLLVMGVGSEAAVTQADVRACTGVVHIIDGLLLPITLPGKQAAPAPAAFVAGRGAGGA
jgi:hypothetical protein